MKKSLKVLSSVTLSFIIMFSTFTVFAAEPRTRYNWNTNPNDLDSAAIWIKPHSYAKVPGPYWGGFLVEGTGTFYVTWNGADSRTCPMVTLEDGGNGNVLAAGSTCGATGSITLKHSGISSNGAANIWFYNDSDENYGFWNIKVVTAY